MHSYDQHTDHELISLLKGGDKPAFDQIYERYWKVAYSSAYKILEKEDICLDVVQDIFVWLWEHREKLEIHTLKSYILTAVKFKLLNVIRNTRLREEVYTRLPNRDFYLESDEENVEIKELRQLIFQFQEELPEQARKIFFMSRFEFFSNKEIAEKLGLKEKTVKNQINIALKKLKDKLKSDQWFTFFL